ncbi:hypothetical protein NDU88_005658 [Pleurodeles waltl]|uniref:Uncharacterized protein n=1 Tax=Pleurodeles waltl TaxID=8319 RepID=A0AAV7TXX6_PLEWA|nr:hypothetical protein NDU88_005658 [Pleurodeles waltl]
MKHSATSKMGSIVAGGGSCHRRRHESRARKDGPELEGGLDIGALNSTCADPGGEEAVEDDDDPWVEGLSAPQP